MNRFAPSKVWFGFISFLWKRIPTRDRFIILGSFLLPAANRISTLTAFGVTIRALTQALYSPLTSAQEWLLGGAILVAFLISEATSVIMGVTDASIRRICCTLARGLRADELIRNQKQDGFVQEDKRRRSKLKKGRHREREEPTQSDFEDDSDEDSETAVEKDIVLKAADLFQNLNRFIAVVVLIVALLLVIGWVSLLASLVMALGGGGLLLFLRRRVGARKTDNSERKQARQELERLEEELLVGAGETAELRQNYINNRHDRLLFETIRERRIQRGKTTALGGIGAAVAMMVVFLFATKGLMREVDPAILVVLILAFRLCVGQGKVAIDRWSFLLSERELLAELRRMVEGSVQGNTPPTPEAEDSEDLSLQTADDSPKRAEPIK